MSTIVSKLTPKDKKALARFYETEAYLSLLKLLKLVKSNAANKALEAVDFHQLKHLQGQGYAMRALEEVMKEIYKSDQKS